MVRPTNGMQQKVLDVALKIIRRGPTAPLELYDDDNLEPPLLAFPTLGA